VLGIELSFDHDLTRDGLASERGTCGCGQVVAFFLRSYDLTTLVLGIELLCVDKDLTKDVPAAECDSSGCGHMVALSQ